MAKRLSLNKSSRSQKRSRAESTPRNLVHTSFFHTNLQMPYQTALIFGSPFLCLLRRIRDIIYAFSLDPQTPPHLTSIEVSPIISITLPSLCNVNLLFCDEVTELVLAQTTFVIMEEAVIYTLFAWLDVIQNTKGGSKVNAYEAVRKIEVLGLEVFERNHGHDDLFCLGAGAKRLFSRLRGVKEVTIMIDLRDVVFENAATGLKKIDPVWMTGKYDLSGLAKLPLLESVALTLKPYMALEKRVKSLEQMNQSRGYGDHAEEQMGIQGFWGLKSLIEMIVAEEGHEIRVVCPKMDDIVV